MGKTIGLQACTRASPDTILAGGTLTRFVGPAAYTAEGRRLSVALRMFHLHGTEGRVHCLYTSQPLPMLS
jgi:hypothetical protein